MANGFRLAEAGKADRPRAFQAAKHRRTLRQLGEIDTGLLRRANLEQQGLLKHQRTVAGDRLSFTFFVRGRRGSPARRIDGHWTSSFSAASKAAMSSSVVVSVTATTRPFWRASSP